MASARADNVRDFLGSFAEGPGDTLLLDFEATRSVRVNGTPPPKHPHDFPKLTPGQGRYVDIDFTPHKDANFDAQGRYLSKGTVMRKVIIESGILSISGKLELPGDDPFAEQVLQGFSVVLKDVELTQLTCENTRRQVPYSFFAKVFQAPVRRYL